MSSACAREEPRNGGSSEVTKLDRSKDHERTWITITAGGSTISAEHLFECIT